MHVLDRHRRSIWDLALVSLAFFTVLSSVVLALVTDQAVLGLVDSAALVAGEGLRHVKVRVGQVPLQGPDPRECLLTEVAVSAI